MHMSIGKSAIPQPLEEAKSIRVCALIDGFNVYHSLEHFDHGVDPADRAKYQKYKWLCLTTLAKRFIKKGEELAHVKYFTAFPDWNQAKRLRHETYVSAQKYFGVEVIKGEFKDKKVECRADGGCGLEFYTKIEKQTDINIAVAMIDVEPEYDKILLFTADTDQVPAVELFKRLHPDKRIAVVIPIGRGAKQLAKVCGESFKIEEADLIASLLPNPLPIMRDGKQISMIVKPTRWP